MTLSEVTASDTTGTLSTLESVCQGHDLNDLARRLGELTALIAQDMVAFEREMSKLESQDSVVRQSASMLLSVGGKRLRPTCVMLASKLGTGFSAQAQDLAVAVELVHNATLLHDDVVDLGDQRRGKPAARMVYGNAASIFAGDWLLIDALRRVRHTELFDVMDRLFVAIDDMIDAEARQLEGRGRVHTGRDAWLRVVEGKTAALFRWAMYAGGRAGGLPVEVCEQLERYGMHLGVAFQAVDDVLDLTGDARVTGKALFADVREGKMTWPLIVAVERRPDVAEVLNRIVGAPADAPVDEALYRKVVDALTETGAVRDCVEMARERAAQAIACLEAVPEGPAKNALITVAEAAINRNK